MLLECRSSGVNKCISVMHCRFNGRKQNITDSNFPSWPGWMWHFWNRVTTRVGGLENIAAPLRSLCWCKGELLKQQWTVSLSLSVSRVLYFYSFSPCNHFPPPLALHTSQSTWLTVICQIPPSRLLCLNQSDLTSFQLICTPVDWFSSLAIICCSIPSLPQQIKL